MSKRTIILTAAWIIAFIIALSVDYPVAHWVHTSGFDKHVKDKTWAQVVKEPGEIVFTLVVAILLALFRRINPKQAAFVFLSGVVGGANVLIKWTVGRWRPYKFPGTSELKPFDLLPFLHGLKGLFNQHDLCFPSGHECNAAALAVAIFFVWRRGAWIFILLAIAVGIERPAENAHYVSDVIGAIGFVTLSTTLLYRLLADWMNPKQPRGFEVMSSPTAAEPQKALP